MAKVWVQAIAICHYEKSGRQLIAHPGDWFEVGKHDAKRWLAEGKIEIPDLNRKATVQAMFDCAVVLHGDKADAIGDALKRRYPSLEISSGDALVGSRCLLWDTSAPLRMELIGIGFGLLETWHLAVPLLDYDTQARHIGTERDRGITKDVLRDLRVPVYDTRIIFARNHKANRDLFAAWQEEKQRGDDERLAFLRAMHRTIPLINALPPIWRK